MNTAEIDKLFIEIIKKLPFPDLGIMKKQKVKENFYKNNKDPILCYDKKDLSQYKIKLQNIVCDKTKIGLIYEEKRKELLLKLEIYQSVGTELFDELCQKLFPLPSEELVSVAKHILNTTPVEKPEQLSIPVKDVKKYFETILIKNNIPCTVLVKPITTKARIDVGHKTLELQQNSYYSKKIQKRLLFHEIGTHQFRILNGEKYAYKIFEYGFANYLQTEEGLAIYTEYIHNVLSQNQLRNYAGRVIAIHLASKYGFKKTYEQLLNYFTKEEAFTLTLRAKRGFHKTSRPGAFAKDIVYLKGFLQIMTYSHYNDITNLYGGKVSLQHIDMITKKPTYLVKYLVL